jgi:putative pyruvate formate lyase activating enzyme
MDGVIDIYMPDFKFWHTEMARQYSKAPNYPEAARRVIKAMHQQTGDLVVDENNLALRGLILRHLVMPGGIAGTREIMEWVARELGPDTYVNVMAQYYPAGKVSSKEYVEINRHITHDEFSEALATSRAAGLWRLDGRSIARLV